MKKIFSVMAGLLIASAMMAQEPVITFEKDMHDFGKINEADGRVTTVFNFKNEGPAPLVLSNVRASCGCTTPKWTREPIEPGATGAITVTYNPSGRPGKFSKTITVTSNATEPTKKLYIKGEVIPKPVTPVVTYPVKIGELSLSTKQINFGDLYKGNTATQSIEYANETSNPLKVEASQQNWLNTQVSLMEVPTNTTGKLIVLFDGNNCPEYGPVKAQIVLTINGKEMTGENNVIAVTANVKEDFSNLTAEQKMNAPILDIASDIDLGILAAGKKISKSLKFSNAGVNPLYIRRILAADDMSFPTVKNGLKSGKKELRFTINTIAMAKSKYQRTITIISNDPLHPVQNIRLSWEVQ